MLAFPPVIFYIIFLPLTIYPVFFIFKLFSFQVTLAKDILTLNSQPLVFVSACIAPYAYYLILMLIMLTKDIKPLARLKMFLLASLLILLANIARILILTFILFNFGNDIFSIFHISFWYFVSTLYVVIIWLLLTRIYKVKSIPVYTDFKYLLEHSIFKKKVLNKHK